MLEKVEIFIERVNFMRIVGLLFVIISMFEQGVEGGVTFLTGVFICYAEDLLQELKILNRKKD